jgi:hypothetical protein
LEDIPWICPVGVRLEVSEGELTIYIVLLPGGKSRMTISFIVVPVMVFIFITVSDDKVPRTLKSFHALVSNKGIDIGLFVAPQVKKEDVWSFYNWILKALESRRLIIEFIVVEEDGNLAGFRRTFTFNEKWKMFFRELSKRYMMWYSDELKGFEESENSTITFNTLRPTLKELGEVIDREKRGGR